jgi:Helix-turn-helix domain
MSHLPGSMDLVRQRIRSDVGVTQFVKLRLKPSAAQVELLRGYCGVARAAYNILLHQVRANTDQRAAEKTYDLTDADLTPALSWHRLSHEKLLRQNREQ